LEVSIQEVGKEFHVTGTVVGAPVPETPSAKTAEEGHRKIMVMVTNDCMGHGDDVLGQKLMISFLKTLKEMGEDLWRLVFVNNGVKMTIKGSDVLPIIREHEKAGIYILVCGTCLTHFNLLDQKQVGETTNMLDIVTAMQLADKVITI
jgi:selenium metabolism protein YedF